MSTNFNVHSPARSSALTAVPVRALPAGLSAAGGRIGPLAAGLDRTTMPAANDSRVGGCTQRQQASQRQARLTALANSRK
jgi:hypothetical protein